MMRILLAALLTLSLVTVAVAQPAPAPPRLLCLARAIEGMLDLEILGKVLQLKLTDPQLQTLLAVYQQHPGEPLDLQKAQLAADRLDQIRAEILTGTRTEMDATTQQEIQKMLEEAFKEFSPPPPAAATTRLSDAETLVWGMLTTTQKSMLLSGGGNGDDRDNTMAVQKVLKIAGDYRGRGNDEWPAVRDRLAVCLATGAGPEGSAARENSRQMVLDFLNRLHGMTDADFANKQKELAADLRTLLTPESNLLGALAEFDPGTVRFALVRSLLSPKARELLTQLAAERAKKAK